MLTPSSSSLVSLVLISIAVLTSPTPHHLQSSCPHKFHYPETLLSCVLLHLFSIVFYQVNLTDSGFIAEVLTTTAADNMILCDQCDRHCDCCDQQLSMRSTTSIDQCHHSDEYDYCHKSLLPLDNLQ